MRNQVFPPYSTSPSLPLSLSLSLSHTHTHTHTHTCFLASSMVSEAHSSPASAAMRRTQAMTRSLLGSTPRGRCGSFFATFSRRGQFRHGEARRVVDSRDRDSADPVVNSSVGKPTYLSIFSSKKTTIIVQGRQQNKPTVQLRCSASFGNIHESNVNAVHFRVYGMCTGGEPPPLFKVSQGPRGR